MIAGAIAIRLAALGGAELTVSEAERAIDALAVSNGATPETWTGDFSASITSYLFDIFGESEALARLPSAVGGSLLVAVLWFARPFTGKSGALIGAALIALSPLFVLSSRSAEPFAIGATVTVLAAFSLLAYLRDPGPVPLFSFALFAGLATLTDAVAVSGVLALAMFVGAEGLLTRNSEIKNAWQSFRRSPLQWAIVVIIAAAVIQLGLTHFGTTTDKLGLPGLTLWSEMFETPRDSRAPEFLMALLLGYDWPVLLAGVGGIAVLATRIRGLGLNSLTPLERLLLVWVALSATIIALTTQREAGQLLILLVPLALLGGVLGERLLRTFDWSTGMRRWPIPALALLFTACAALITTEWAAGNASVFQRVLIGVFAALAVTLVAAPILARTRDGAIALVTVVAILGVTFTSHSALAVAFEGGSEFARDKTLLESREPFIDTLAVLAEDRDGPVIIEASLRDELEWALRDTPYVFGGSLDEASIFVGLASEAPDGFVTVAGEWLIAEEWSPQEILKPLNMWDWMLFRKPYGDMTTIAVQIYVLTI